MEKAPRMPRSRRWDHQGGSSDRGGLSLAGSRGSGTVPGAPLAGPGDPTAKCTSMHSTPKLPAFCTWKQKSKLSKERQRKLTGQNRNIFIYKRNGRIRAKRWENFVKVEGWHECNEDWGGDYCRKSCGQKSLQFQPALSDTVKCILQCIIAINYMLHYQLDFLNSCCINSDPRMHRLLIIRASNRPANR